MSLAEQQALENEFVMHTFGRKPVELVRGEGMWVYDSQGREYLDFLAGIGTVSLGHCHPEVTAALVKQTEKLVHVGNYYYIEGRGEVAHALSDLLNATQPEPERDPWQSFFGNSGAEANECAIKLARLWGKERKQGASTIVALEKSFHGRTLVTLAATGQPGKQEAFQPVPAGFMHTPINDIAALEELFEAQGESICAIMVECVQGESGVHPCTADYLQAASRIAKAHNALLICDEIQCGMYRCGEYPFGFQHFGIVPDIVTMAKGIASGFPTGVCAARAEVASLFGPGDHGSTFGGSCLAIAAIAATLSVLKRDDLATQVNQVGEYLRARLATIPAVTEVRGLGLMCACDIDESKSAPEIVDCALEAGMLINATGPQTLRFLPPLICSKEDVDAFMERLLGLF